MLNVKDREHEDVSISFLDYLKWLVMRAVNAVWFTRGSMGWCIRLLAMGVLCSALSGIAHATPLFVLSSPAFGNNRAIPLKFTCDGSGNSPPMVWSPPPAGTQSLALLVTDPDAPGGIWVHWVLYNLSPGLRGVEQHMGKLPSGSRPGVNSWGRIGYGAPCPPSGHHHYIFRLYALDRTFLFAHPPDREKLLSAIHGHILAIATLVGIYGHPK